MIEDSEAGFSGEICDVSAMTLHQIGQLPALTVSRALQVVIESPDGPVAGFASAL